MTFYLAPLRDPPDYVIGAVVIADTEARTVRTLRQAGAEPEISDVTTRLIAEKGLVEPLDLIGAEVTNERCDVPEEEMQQFDSLAEALAAADLVLARAQGGREPRPDVPVDLVTQVHDLEYALTRHNATIRAAEAQLGADLERLLRALTREIHLPDRHGAQATKAASDEGDDYARVRSLLATGPTEGLDSLSLPDKLLSALENAGFVTLDTLAACSKRDLLGVEGIGERSVERIQAALRSLPEVDLLNAPIKTPKPKRSKPARGLAPAQQDESQSQGRGRGRGRVKWFNAAKGFGFIGQDDGGPLPSGHRCGQRCAVLPGVRHGAIRLHGGGNP